MADLALKVDGIAKIAGRRHILRDVSFIAGSGELIAVLGRNGAGKTTLLSVLAGRLNPDRALFRWKLAAPSKAQIFGVLSRFCRTTC